MTEFDKWWNDLKKHRKRLQHWLPHWRTLAGRIANGRPIRYFTLCARPMIDVFMLVNEGLLHVDPENNSINRVQFCECVSDQFDEIREMIAREDAGFFGKLENVVLFEEDEFTREFPTPESISMKLEEQGLHSGLPDDLEKVERLQLKRTNFDVKASFPYDLLNLDFCDYYYPIPPGMLRVNDTIERLLGWQRKTSDDGEGVRLEEFVLAVTCRHDAKFPADAESRLAELINDNCSASREYREEVEKTRGRTALEELASWNKEDLFFSGWPKDIARLASKEGWRMEVLDYVYYRRPADKDVPYLIACLVARFSRADHNHDDLPTALYALNDGNRSLINDIDRRSAEGERLLESLQSIVEVRNGQARRQRRPELPHP